MCQSKIVTGLLCVVGVLTTITTAWAQSDKLPRQPHQSIRRTSVDDGKNTSGDGHDEDYQLEPDCDPPAEPGNPSPADGAADATIDLQLAWAGQVVFTERVISTTANQVVSVFAADMDGDEDTDVLSLTFWGRLAWYESDGGSPPGFVKRTISPGVAEGESVMAADVDGDGNIDILTASAWIDGIAWWRNDGGSPPRFFRQVITPGDIGATSVFAADMDSDGDTDVLSGKQPFNGIVWYENDGGSPPSFTERGVSSTTYQPVIFAADVNGDGDTDVLSASWFDDKIAWYENDGGSPPDFTERVISTAADGVNSVFAADVDGDGDTDVLSASFSDDKIAWYENDGGSPPDFTERVISTAADGANTVFAADVDGDGDTDVLSASWGDDTIAWYENDGGSPPVFTPQVISTAADGARSVFATDMDGDGDTDVLSASYWDDKIAWYENDNAGPCQTTYDVYLGTDPTCSTLTMICENLTEPMCDIVPLERETTYYWQLVAEGFSGETLGPCWSFTTNSCGNGVLDTDEDCDDGNNVDGDGCQADCTIPEYACGDFDNVGGVDLDDYAGFWTCVDQVASAMAPASGSSSRDDCTDAFDCDGDGDIDLIDWGQLQAAFTGPD